MKRPGWFASAVLIFSALPLMIGSAAAQTTFETPIPPTATPAFIDLDDGWQLADQTTTEALEQPYLTISISIPVLAGSDSEVVDGFNAAIAAIVTDNVEPLREQMIEFSDLPSELADLGSYFGLSYEVFAAASDLISIRFTADFYSAGAAHPGSYSIPLNYDLVNGGVLALADVFKPDAPYLELLSIYAIQALSQTEAFMFPEGAEPTEENYRSWNITQDGLLITFDAYQVAPYAAGPQEVLIAYDLMPGIINPDGVLAGFIDRENNPA